MVDGNISWGLIVYFKLPHTKPCLLSPQRMYSVQNLSVNFDHWGWRWQEIFYYFRASKLEWICAYQAYVSWVTAAVTFAELISRSENWNRETAIGQKFDGNGLRTSALHWKAIPRTYPVPSLSNLFLSGRAFSEEQRMGKKRKLRNRKTVSHQYLKPSLFLGSNISWLIRSICTQLFRRLWANRLNSIQINGPVRWKRWVCSLEGIIQSEMYFQRTVYCFRNQRKN